MDRTTGKDDGAAHSTRDRAIGALVGLAVGDAVGATLEFRQPGTFRPIDDMVGGGPHHLRPGQWTDDTSMAMCLAESILDTGGLDPQDQLRRYVAWRDHGYWSSKDHCFDIGLATAAALTRFVETGDVIEEPVDQDRAANGSLMRLAPVPIRWFTDIDAAVDASGSSSTTTHAADRPVDACRLFGAMIAALVAGTDIAEVLDPGFWRFGHLDPTIENVARGSWRGRHPPEIRGSGYVVDSLEAALWAVGGATDFRTAVLRAANLGDDADTTAAIAGQLAGARWGASAVPSRWRQLLVARRRIEAIAGRLHDMATASTATDGDPTDPWPHDDLLHGYWVEPGRILAGEYPARRGDRSVTEEKLNLLIDHGVRTIVDLTHPVDGMAPYDSALRRIAADRGLTLQRIAEPIPDMGVVEPGRYREIVSAILAARESGAVYFHCRGGIGRTGTVAGCLLVESGLSGAEALQRLDDLRSVTRKAASASPETDEQVRIILDHRPTRR